MRATTKLDFSTQGSKTYGFVYILAGSVLKEFTSLEFAQF